MLQLTESLMLSWFGQSIRNFVPKWKTLGYHIDFTNLLFCVFWACLATPTKINSINFQKNWCLYACKNQLHRFLLFLRDIVKILNLPFWLLWAWLAMTGKKNTISLWKTLMFVFMQKIKFIPYLFLEILQRYCKLVILATLGVPGNTQQKRYQLLIENSWCLFANQKSTWSVSFF